MEKSEFIKFLKEKYAPTYNATQIKEKNLNSTSKITLTALSEEDKTKEGKTNNYVLFGF